MVDIDAAIGYVVAHGDAVDRARLSWLVSGHAPGEDVLATAEVGQTMDGGWPALLASDVASVDATCFRLGELDDLGALQRPAARRAIGWLTTRQRPDGSWQEDQALAASAPPWAVPGDPEAALYLTASAGFTLAIAGAPGKAGEAASDGARYEGPTAEQNAHAVVVARAAEAFRAHLRPDGTWPSFLVAGWLGAALLHHVGWFYESAQIQAVLGERVPGMSPADVAAMGAALRRVGVGRDEWSLVAVRRRLAETQRTDGGWESDDGGAFNVHTTLAAIRAAR